MRKSAQKQLKKVNVELIWEEQNFNEKKLMLLEFVKSFRFPKKIPLFEQQINRSTSNKQLDQIALNIHMAGEGLCKI